MIEQTQKNKLAFEGVYLLENPQAVLVLKGNGDEFYGYISDGEQAYKIIGEMTADFLRLIKAEGTDRAVNYLALDENGNLMLTDEQLRVIYFTRSSESVDELITSIEKQRVTKKDTKTNNNSDLSKGSSLGKNWESYANKKFLHIYTGNGNAAKWAYYLFANGGFYFKSSDSDLSSFSYSDFNLISSDLDAGKWTVEFKEGNEFLVLSWNSGQRLSLQIQKAEFGYLLNGVQYFLVGHEEYE